MQALDTSTVNGFTVRIYPDEGSMFNPRNDQTPGCQLVLYHRRYDWPNDAGIDLDDLSAWAEVAAELRKHHGALYIEPVWAYEHSGIALHAGSRVGQFADQWDSGCAGLAYVTAKNWKETQGTEWTGSDADLVQAHNLIAGDVQNYSRYANGEIYCYTITDEYGEQVAEGGGCLGWDVVEEAATEAANELAHEVKCNGTLNRSAGEIEHAGPCPLHDAGSSR